MFCIHCGTQNSDSSRFCIKCGQPLDQAQQPAAPQQDAWQAPAQPTDQQQDWAQPTQQVSPADPWLQPEVEPQWGQPEAAPVAPQAETAWEGEPDSFTGGSASTGEAAWPGAQSERSGESSGDRWVPFPDSEPSYQPASTADWAPAPGPAAGTEQGLTGTAGQNTIVRDGTWSSADLVAPPPPPAPTPAAGRGRPGLVIALCLATALCGAGALTYLLLRDKLVAAQAPVFSIFIPIALGGAALVFAAAAVLVILTSRQPVQQVIDDLPPHTDIPYQPAPPASAGIPVTLTDTARPNEPFHLLLEGPVVIGRVQEECDLALPYEKSVSKRHCRIYPAQGTVYVADLGGRNGTYLNGTQVVVPTSLHSGDMIKLGRLVLRVDIG